MRCVVLKRVRPARGVMILKAGRFQVTVPASVCTTGQSGGGVRAPEFRRFYTRPRSSAQACFQHWEQTMLSIRACHWVSAYVRLRFGRVEYVCGHWRCCG